jgi:hypothetical protein
MHTDLVNRVKVFLLDEGLEYARLDALQRIDHDAIVLAARADRPRAGSSLSAWGIRLIDAWSDEDHSQTKTCDLRRAVGVLHRRLATRRPRGVA